MEGPTRGPISVCPYCGVGCRLRLDVRDGRPAGTAAEAEAAPNFGNLCQKGSYLDRIFSGDSRLLTPLFRERTGDPFRPISWDEAITRARDAIRQTLTTRGPDGFGFYGSGQMDTEGSYLFTKFVKGALGTNQMDTNSRLCMASAASGYAKSLGHDGPPPCYEDIDHAETVLILGSNMAVNHPVLFQRLRNRRTRHPDLKVLCADPRRTKTAEASDLHLPLAPGGDVAFLTLLARKLLELGRANQSFIESRTHGFEAFREGLFRRSERELLSLSGLDATTFHRALFALEKPGRFLSFYCQGVNQSTRGVDGNLALIHLHLLLGEIGKPGAGPFSLTGQPNAMGGREVGYLAHQLPGYRFVHDAAHRREMEELWDLPEGRIQAKAGPPAMDLFRKLGPGGIETFWIACTNPVVSMPESEAVKAALARCPFVIVQDCIHPTETTAYAHLLLPAAQWGEKDGTMTNSERRVARTRATFAPPGMARPDFAIVASVARAMGFSGFDFETVDSVWDEIRRVLRGRPCDVFGMTNERLNVETLQWPCPDSDHPGTARLHLNGRFGFPDGRARFAHIEPRPPAEWSSADYPLLLTTGRVYTQWHTRTRTGRVPELNRLDPDPFIEIHPLDAAKYRVEEGSALRLEGRRGACVAPARITDAVPPGLLFMPFHWGDGHHPESNVNDLTQPAADPVSAQPELKLSAVRIVPAIPLND